MNRKPGWWMVCYGIFLMAMGVTGYASNPEKAKTALMSGSTFGALSVLWGWLMTRGVTWSRGAGLVTTLLLLAVFTWRASVSWLAYAGGAQEKLIPAVLITLMGIASLTMAGVLWKHRAQPAR